MAFMKDRKPLQFAGEQLVWEQLKQNLPEEIRCYNHRELNGREFDFCLLIPEMGFLILEVKGWNFRDIAKVVSPDEIYLNGMTEPVHSPKKQARGYRFDLLNQLHQKYHIDPLVMDMVCYPFLTQQEYERAGLSIVSEPEFTLFSEDLHFEQQLKRKISRAYLSLHRVAKDACIGNIYDICRKHFEPNYVIKPPMPTAIPYSCLSVYAKPLTLAEIQNILHSYFEGIKQTIFVCSMSDLDALAENLTVSLKERNLCVQKENLQFGEQKNKLPIRRNRLSLFQFEAIYFEPMFPCENFTVYNGMLSQQQTVFLSRLSELTLFNLEQYFVEHAPVDKHIQVRAGAGTGKTYSMVSRIAFLCHFSSNSGVFAPADEIAMLTFTSDAAVNMKVRLKQMFLNYFVLTKNTKYLELVSDIEKMRISTIHSFAGEVFRNTSLALGIGTNFTTISGYYDRNMIFERFFNDYLTKKNHGNPLFFETLPVSIYDFQKYLRQIAGMLYNKGCDIKEISSEMFGTPPDEMPYLQDIIEQVVIPTEQEYELFLAENNQLHLSEYMIYLRKCISFEEFNTNLFHFKYVFIDEFQDTDDAQISAFLAMQEKMNFNFFIVGDLKQSIYRFRGATMDAFQQMGKPFNKWLEYHLTINYRTDARILNQFDSVFFAMGQQGLLPYHRDADRLIGALKDEDIPNEELVKCIPYYQTEVNNGTYYDKLFKEVEQKKILLEQRMQHQKLSLSERTIAILTRTNYQIETVLRQARKRNFHIESTSGGDLYQLQSTLDLCKLTSALCHPYHATYLYDLICSNNVKVSLDPKAFFGVDDARKTELCIQCLDMFYRETLGKTWNQLIYEAQHEPILKVLRIIYEGSEPWKRYSNGFTQQDFYRANYDLLFEELSKMNQKSYLTLDSVNESLHIAITTGEEREPRNLEQVQDGVRILCTTVHKSKGLEYGTVILPFTDRDNTGFNYSGIEVTYVNGKVGYCLKFGEEQYQNSYFDTETESQETLMEESRILYVAMTRAIHHFIWFRKEADYKRSWGKLLEGLSYD